MRLVIAIIVEVMSNYLSVINEMVDWTIHLECRLIQVGYCKNILSVK